MVERLLTPEELRVGKSSLYSKQPFTTLKTHRDFDMVYKKGRRFHSDGFILFFLPGTSYKVGFTASKKIGNAVHRNRCKRVLRSIFYSLFQQDGALAKGTYVFVAKIGLLHSNFQALLKAFNYHIKGIKKFVNTKKNSSY